MTVDAPHLRIITPEAFAAVERRFEVTKKLWGIGTTGRSRGQQKHVYLFSGLLQCGECGGSITLVAGRAKTSRSEYGCSLHAQRGKSVCKNDLLIRRDHLEEQIIGGLKEKVLREEAIDYVVVALQEELQQRHETINAELQSMRDERRRIEGELQRLVESIAVGNGSPAIMVAINDREARLRAITDKLIEPGPESFQQKLDELRAFAVTKLARLRALLSAPSAVHEARASRRTHRETNAGTYSRAGPGGLPSERAD